MTDPTATDLEIAKTLAAIVRMVTAIVVGGYVLNLGSRLVGAQQPRDWARAVPGYVLMALGISLVIVALSFRR